MAKVTSTRKPKLATPPDPNRCFVFFPSTHLTAGTVAVGLESILRQVQKHGSERNVTKIALDESTRKLTIEFESGGDSLV
ncbi:hypothetical protein ACE3MQ_19905 [Paenibacillus lentus]|uniref:hypothetical protein n=1 Tax=Paenibacillus lentus TaxID=1338368 RepID=UPI00366440F8